MKDAEMHDFEGRREERVDENGNVLWGSRFGRRGRRGFGPGGFGPRFGPAFGPGFGPGFGAGRPGRPGRPGPGGGAEPFDAPAFGPGGFGPRRFGPGGFGPGGFGPGGFGPGGHGGRRGGRGGRRQRGNVRIAVLALLAEEPRHGYSIMTELAERSGGLWRPSPGSVYPVLQQLQDEGLVISQDSEGRKVFSLTDAGRRLVQDNPSEYAQPWAVADEGPGQRIKMLFGGMGALGAAVQQVARLGTPEQGERASAVLEEARRSLYRILAEDASGEDVDVPEYGSADSSAANGPDDGASGSAEGDHSQDG